jgi:hypothetical protein
MDKKKQKKTTHKNPNFEKLFQIIEKGKKKELKQIFNRNEPQFVLVHNEPKKNRAQTKSIPDTNLGAIRSTLESKRLKLLLFSSAYALEAEEPAIEIQKE